MILNGNNLMSLWTVSSEKRLPMKRFTSYRVLEGLIAAYKHKKNKIQNHEEAQKNETQKQKTIDMVVMDSNNFSIPGSWQPLQSDADRPQ